VCLLNENVPVYRDYFAFVGQLDSTKESIQAYQEKADSRGKTLEVEALVELNHKLKGLIPDCYIEVLTSLPLAGSDLDWQAFEPETDHDGIETITFLDTSLISECNLDSYPGNILIELGYFTFGYGAAWAGNCFAFNPADGIEPPVYEIWHDAAQDKEGMVKAFSSGEGVGKVSQSFSELFNNAVT
jgi:hypothetical protein